MRATNPEETDKIFCAFSHHCDSNMSIDSKSISDEANVVITEVLDTNYVVLVGG